MTTIGDGCGCDTGCDWKEKLNEAYNRATTSVNKVLGEKGGAWYPDGTGAITLPLGDTSELETRVDTLETSQATQDSDISQLKISDNEHTSQIATLDNTVDTHAREITAIKAKDVSQDSEIQGLSESVVSDLVATFNNNSRKLSLSIEREGAVSIDAEVTIPAGSSGGGSYSAGDGISISDANVISIEQTTKEAIGDSFISVALGSDGKSLDFTANDGQTNNIAIPSSGGALSEIDITDFDDIKNLTSGSIIYGENISLSGSGKSAYTGVFTGIVYQRTQYSQTSILGTIQGCLAVDIEFSNALFTGTSISIQSKDSSGNVKVTTTSWDYETTATLSLTNVKAIKFI